MSAPLWETEGDAFDWTDEATGLPCVMRRGPMGSWCGYVGVEPGSPLHGLDYDKKVRVDSLFTQNRPTKIEEVGVVNLFTAAFGPDNPNATGEWPLTILIRCHGGLTYSGSAWWAEDDPRWWFGFDCSHAFDLVPGVEAIRREFGFPRHKDTYRTAEFVRLVCGQMAEDLDAVAREAVVIKEAAG